MDWNQRYTYNFPTPIRFGAGVINELSEHLKKVGKSKPLIVTDSGLASLPIFNKILNQLNSNGISPLLFTEIAKNPVKSNVLAGVKEFHKTQADSIIGIGGGASMDVARAIALGAHHERDLFDFDDAKGGDKYVTEEIPYFITVPTTSGTGSEVGRSTVISDDNTHEKKILFSPRLMAKIVFADPELTLNLPASITATTGMDALTHNVEAYVAKGFNPLCDGVALNGIKLIAESIVKATKNPCLESRSKMMMAALMGATAFQKGLGVVHSLAHPLSTLFDTHHGLANAICLPYGIEFNESIVKEKYNFLASIIGKEDFKEWIFELNKEISIPKTLSEIGVSLNDIDALSKVAINDACHPSNPKQCTLQDFKEIYKKAITGSL
ncbi:MAG: iron-containing alcohol dehydrogenase [Halobacteriovoraceae bacterium]|nr:iron-containing alcohol dehydrogenase [Halobacteriovoraceae bacterium]